MNEGVPPIDWTRGRVRIVSAVRHTESPTWPRTHRRFLPLEQGNFLLHDPHRGLVPPQLLLELKHLFLVGAIPTTRTGTSAPSDLSPLFRTRGEIHLFVLVIVPWAHRIETPMTAHPWTIRMTAPAQQRGAYPLLHTHTDHRPTGTLTPDRPDDGNLGIETQFTTQTPHFPLEDRTLLFEPRHPAFEVDDLILLPRPESSGGESVRFPTFRSGGGSSPTTTSTATSTVTTPGGAFPGPGRSVGRRRPRSTRPGVGSTVVMVVVIARHPHGTGVILMLILLSM